MTTPKINQHIKTIFCRTLGVKNTAVNSKTTYNSFEAWDSLKHLQFISAIEEKFKISIDMNDVIAMNTYQAVEDILHKYIK